MASTAKEELVKGNAVKVKKDHEVKGAETREDEIETVVEPKTGASFPSKLDDGKVLNSFGLRKKSFLGVGLKICGFGIYVDNAKLEEVLKSKMGKAPGKPTKEMFELVIDSDVEMMVRLVIVYSGLTMSVFKKNFHEGLGASLKKITGGQGNDELVNKVLGAATDDIKLTPGSVIEITRLPGFILQTKVKDAIVSKVESELLCRAYFHLYLGDEPFDKESKERFGKSMISMF